MRRKNRGIAGAVAMFLAFSVSQVFVQATYAKTSAMPGLIGEALMTGAEMHGAKTSWTQGAGAGQLSGQLITSNNQPITVDGKIANPGTTIFSGAQIQTPDGVTATVDLGPLGSVEFAPNTDAELTFTGDQVRVKLRRGCVNVRTKENVKGMVIDPQGTTTEDTDTTKKKRRLNICFPILATTAGVSQGVSVGTVAAIAGGIGAIVIGAVLGSRDNEEEAKATPIPTPSPTPTPEFSPTK